MSQDISTKLRTKDIQGRGLSKNDYSDSYKQVIDNLIPGVIEVTVPKIQPSPTFNYEWYASAQYRQLNTWWIGKSVSQPLSGISHGFKKDITTNGIIGATETGNIKVMIRKAANPGTDVVLLNKTITNAQLQSFATPGLGTDFQNYFLSVDFDTPAILELGDILYCALSVNAQIYAMLGSENALLTTGEWNNVPSGSPGSWRRSDQGISIPSTIPTLPAVNAKYNAVHLYNKTQSQASTVITNLGSDLSNAKSTIGSLQTTVSKTPNKKIETVGASNVTFTLPSGAVGRVVTSTGYDYKGTPDNLIIIFHGNGQTNSSGPSTTARAILAANKISYAIVGVQDQTAEPFTTNATGWGNDIVLQRNTELYNYLMEKYNFYPSVVLAGQSMGMLGVGRLLYTEPFPIKCAISIGGVPDLVYIFNFGINRKPSMRAAYGLPDDGSQDSNFAAIVQGKNWASRNVIDVSGVKYKTLNKRLYMYVGTNDATYSTDFGGDVNYDAIRNSIAAAGGYARYIKVSGLDHANTAIWDTAISDGFLFNEFGIINSGTTAQRPTTLNLQSAGYRYNDTTTGTIVTWNGIAWQ